MGVEWVVGWWDYAFLGEVFGWNYLGVVFGAGHVFAYEGGDLQNAVLSGDVFETDLDQGQHFPLWGLGVVLSGHQPAAHQQLESLLLIIFFELLEIFGVLNFRLGGGCEEDKEGEDNNFPHMIIMQ